MRYQGVDLGKRPASERGKLSGITEVVHMLARQRIEDFPAGLDLFVADAQAAVARIRLIVRETFYDLMATMFREIRIPNSSPSLSS
jgi:hypothetical protein